MPPETDFLGNKQNEDVGQLRPFCKSSENKSLGDIEPDRTPLTALFKPELQLKVTFSVCWLEEKPRFNTVAYF